VTTVLVGSGEGGLSVPEVLQALLRSVSVANERLRRARRDAATDSEELIARIDSVDIIELYEDRAIEATRLAHDVAQLPEFALFDVEPLLVTGDEGQRRARFGQEPGWWQRVRLTGDEHGALNFEAVTHTARVKATLVSTQRQVVEGLVERAIETTAYDAGLGHTLFEVLRGRAPAHGAADEPGGGGTPLGTDAEPLRRGHGTVVGLDRHAPSAAGQ
jgi:hypothetical protein